MGGKLLSIDDILKCPDLEERTVDVPEWGGQVKVKGFSKATQQQMRKEATYDGEIDSDRLEMFMFIYGVIEPKCDKSHYEQLREKSAGAIDKIVKEIMSVSGMDEQTVKKAEKSFRSE